MKHVVIVSFLLFGFVVQAQAGAAGFFGISYALGTSLGDIGITAKVVSDDDENTGVLGAGASYYPFAEEKKFGLDASVGYLFKNSAVMAGFDFLKWKPQLSVGYVNTEDSSSAPAPVSTPVPDPTPPPSEPEGGGAET